MKVQKWKISLLLYSFLVCFKVLDIKEIKKYTTLIPKKF
jgi:hypothetical protein